jgi:predicted Zn finger-like uncharacterized protein
MKFVCERCQTRYSIADEKVRQKILKIRCKTCEHVITVREPQAGAPAPAPSAPAAPPPRPPARDSAEWFVAINGEQAGPATRGEMVKKLVALKAGDEVYVWKEDFDAWKEPAQVPGLMAEVAAAKAPASAPRAPLPPPLARPAPPRPTGGSSGRTALPAPTRGPAPRPAASLGSGPSRAVAARAPAPDSLEETFEGNERTAVAPMDASLLAQDLPAAPAGRVLPFPSSSPVPAARPAHGNGAAAAMAPAPSPSDPLLEDLFNPTPPAAPVAGAASAPTPFFPVPAAPVPVSPAQSGLSRLTGLPGFWSRHSGIKFVALGAAVVLLVGVAAFVLMARPGETKMAAAAAPPPAPAGPAVDPEKQAREEAERRFKATVGGPAPAVASVSRPDPPRREPRRAARSSPTPAPPPVAPPPSVEPSAFNSDHALAGGERVVKTYVPQRAHEAAATHEVSEQQMAAVVRKNQSGIQTCYERALKRDDKLRGRIEVTTSIGASGMVRKVDLRAPSELSPIKSCIETTIRRWAFPASREPYEFAFPLILERNL